LEKLVFYEIENKRYNKNSKIIWFCFCENIDLLEQEILQKLDHIGALVKNSNSNEIFDPNIISFDEIRQEISRLAEQINFQLSANTQKSAVQQDYLKFATTLLELLLPFAKEDPKNYMQFVEKI
jgi:hypothetical protein